MVLKKKELAQTTLKHSINEKLLVKKNVYGKTNVESHSIHYELDGYTDFFGTFHKSSLKELAYAIEHKMANTVSLYDEQGLNLIVNIDDFNSQGYTF